MASRVEVYSKMEPPLQAGDYELVLAQDMAATSADDNPLGAVPEEVRSFTVTSPRLAMPGTELFSVYPPPNAVGAFETRLPQVALRRRTLPWERAMPGGVPWLALVVLADAECTFLQNVRPPDAISPAAAAALGIVDDGSRADTIEVNRTVVDRAFPRKDELALLAHVRHVDVSDTELAGNDDDGWVAVLLANRLPQPGLRYRACVVSLEGQFEVLADPPAISDAVDTFGSVHVFHDVPAHLIEAARASQGGSPVELASTDQPLVATRVATLGTISSKETADAWSVGSPKVVAETQSPARASYSQFTVADVSLAILQPLVPRYRFPVLASWTFTCEEGGDFEYLMQHLDVGLLGTLPDADPADNGPPPPTVLETGHTEIVFQRRRGFSGPAWYRGPLTPREVRRRPATTPFATADQARRMATDGVEDLSEASAFEIGRLLALASPRFVAALRSWANDGFAVRRLLSGLNDAGFRGELGADLGRSFVLQTMTALAGDGGHALGPRLPIVDLGELDTRPDVELIAKGFGFDPGFVQDVLAPRPSTVAVPTEGLVVQLEQTLDSLAGSPEQLADLRVGLESTVAAIARDARVEATDRPRFGDAPPHSTVERLWPDDEGDHE